MLVLFMWVSSQYKFGTIPRKSMSYSTIQLLENTTFVFVSTDDSVRKRFELPDPSTCPGRLIGFKSQGDIPFDIQTQTSSLAHTAPFEARLLLSDGQSDWVSLASYTCLLYTSPSPRDLSTSRMPSSA